MTNDLAAIAGTIGRSFPLLGSLALLAGGEGRTYRAGDYVYRKEHRRAEAAYVADVYMRLPSSGFRIPRPIRSNHGTWLSSDGWSAWSFLPGRPVAPDDVPIVLP